MTVLLLGVTLDGGGEVADHLWLNETEGFKAVGPLSRGDAVAFDARVTMYEKGYRGRGFDDGGVETDCRLSWPTSVALLERAEVRAVYSVCGRCGYYCDAEATSCRRCGMRFDGFTAQDEKMPEKPRLTQMKLG